MFLRLEVWDERPRDDNRPIIVGGATDAYLDMKELRVMSLPVNVYTIISFEHIRINTIGRPRSAGNHADCLSGVRIRLADGTQYVVIDQKEDTFEALLQKAKELQVPIVNVGRSPYMEQFMPLNNPKD